MLKTGHGQVEVGLPDTALLEQVEEFRVLRNVCPDGNADEAVGDDQRDSDDSGDRTLFKSLLTPDAGNVSVDDNIEIFP